MTRSRSGKMKQLLQGLVMDLQDKEAAWVKSNMPPRLITLLWVVEDLAAQLWIKRCNAQRVKHVKVKNVKNVQACC